MTRQIFIDTINDWSELIDFCNDNDCDVCVDIFDGCSMDEEINNAIDGYVRDYDWYNLRDMLNDIPTGYDYYCQNSSFDWDGMDENDFRNYKDDVITWMDNEGYWDEEEDNYEEEDLSYEDEQEDAPPIEEEDFSVGDLIGMCSVKFATIQKDNLRREEESNDAFRQYVGANVPKVLF